MIGNLILFGTLIGFLIFIINTIQVGKIFYRPNSENILKFTFGAFFEYLIAPFDIGTPRFKILWGLASGMSLKDRLLMLQLNWVFMTSLSTLVILAWYYI